VIFIGSPPCYVESRANRLPIGSFTQTKMGKGIREPDGTSSCFSLSAPKIGAPGGSPRGSPRENLACRAVPVCAARSLPANPFRYRLSAHESTLCRGVPHPAESCRKRPFLYGVQEVAGSNPVGPIFGIWRRRLTPSNPICRPGTGGPLRGEVPGNSAGAVFPAFA